MSGPWSSYADLFLVLLAVSSIALLGLPLLFAPLAWARVLAWPLPEEQMGRVARDPAVDRDG